MASPDVVALVSDARLRLNALIQAAQADGDSKEVVDELIRKDAIIAAQAARIDTLEKQVARLEKVVSTDPVADNTNPSSAAPLIAAATGFLAGRAL